MMQELMRTSLFYSAIQTIALSIFSYVTFLYNPEVWVGDYPKDVKTAYGEISSKSKRDKKLLVAVFLLIAFGVPVLMLVNTNVSGYSFTEIVLCLFLMFQVFNLFDLLIIDWLILNTITPKFLVLKGTEGLPGYKNYSFHFKGFLIGTGISLLASLIITGTLFLLT